LKEENLIEKEAFSFDYQRNGTAGGPDDFIVEFGEYDDS